MRSEIGLADAPSLDVVAGAAYQAAHELGKSADTMQGGAAAPT